MSRPLLCGALLAALLWQGWAQASVAPSTDPAQAGHCGDRADPGDGHDCCQDEGAAGGDCETFCGLSPALVAEAAVIRPARSQTPQWLQPPGRAGPDYLPLNPPPIS